MMERRNRYESMLLFFFVTVNLPHLDLIAVEAARGFRHSGKNGPLSEYSKSLKSSGLFPSIFNVATKADVYVNATCGEDGPETFCKPSESSRCAVCDSRSPDPGKRHDIRNILDPNPGRWWQSPTLAKGDSFQYVTIVLDLKQVYQIEYVIVKSANSPRPAAWVLERSVDGENFEPWQYYAPSDEECWARYSVPPVTGKPNYIGDDEVICTSAYSRQTPMENGEIHTHLINGRPGASNHSSALLSFIQARFVRLRLQGLGRIGETIADKRRAFYSIKEINIGGRCLCSGHAARCRYSVHHRHQECECERHTCGEKCEKCCPMYNQIPWKPGTAGRGFHCEKCNCHGHATSCRFDPEVAEKKLSMDIRGKYRGGGVCVNCTNNTAGINCEKCRDGYYRPNGVLPDASEPCLPCDCNIHGSTGYCTPDDSFTRMGKVAGACECKPGYSGYKCDQCAAGYRQFPDCMPCPCDARGVLPSHDCEGDCLCKANVAGEYCDRCKSGFFALTRDNLDGCLQCDCFGAAKSCAAAKLSYSMISTLENWLVTDINATKVTRPTLDTDNNWLTIASFEIPYDSFFWSAPKIYAGNRLSSYGSNLTYSVSWVVMRGDTSGKATIEPNVILIGNGLQIAYGEEQYSGQENEISVPLQEQGWYHIKNEAYNIPIRLRKAEFRGEAVTRTQMIRVLAGLEHILIRAQYHSEQVEASLMSMILPLGEVSSDGDSESLVEVCECPQGYTGLSCENCDWGYVKVFSNTTGHVDRHHICVKCDCNGHAASCDLVMGECSNCEHNTVGPKCDRCVKGYYGDPTRGTAGDCKRCACPLLMPSNNFSPSCQLDDPSDTDSDYVCTQCPKGYTGDHCESCDVGFFGNPMNPGGVCEPCLCHGAPCDQETGRCLECTGNTEGWKCDRCKEAHFGDALQQNCTPCNCDPLGSSSVHCEKTSGQCPCEPLFAGRDCSSCIQGYGNVTAGCQECDCDIGAVTEVCDPVSGKCRCSIGVIGFRCDQCDVDHYGLSRDGCKGCRCNLVGSTSSACDIVTGQCQCKPHVMGRQCDRCEVGYWGLSMGVGCSSCDCDSMGSYDASCHEDTGQCSCKPGIGGIRCDKCLAGYYGFSSNGCQLCDVCDRPGHICDPDTGRCICPTLAFGEHCDRCRPGSYHLVPGKGCKPCACSPGSLRTQCDFNGQCSCRIGFDGLRCDRCAKGYYGYPRCKPCNCNAAGTVPCESDVCECDAAGQCPCKQNAIGRQCDECREGTFGLSSENVLGCTECFCFGRSTNCQQAGLAWGQRRLLRPRVLYINDTINDVYVNKFGYSTIIPSLNGGLNSTNGLSLIPETEGDVSMPINLYYDYPLYWQLPESFLGDKVISYGGYLRFKIVTEGGTPLRSNNRYPLVQLRGNNKIILEHYPIVPPDNNRYSVRLQESFWQLQNRPDYKVTREILMVALQNLQYIFVKASDHSDFTKAVLLEASLDAAILTPTHSPPLATGIEVCECPMEYNGTSCQDPSLGFYRWYNNATVTSTIIIDLVGQAKPCECNGRSEICEKETGYCLSCRENTAGASCEKCADSFHGHPDFGGCRPCPCPQDDKRFSSSCIVRSDSEPVCHCKPGYAGSRCEKCSYGFYGTPRNPGGKCIPCNCNLAGSTSDDCDPETGQCNCRAGSTGRDCSECLVPRHVFINNVCTSCDDNCTGIFLDEIAVLVDVLARETTHIADGYIPPPWEELSLVDSNITRLLGVLEFEDELKRKLNGLPWQDYERYVAKAESSLRRANDQVKYGRTVHSNTESCKRNVTDVSMEIGETKKQVKDIVEQLSRYGDDEKKIETRKALMEAKMILKHLKSVNLSKKTKEIETLIQDVEDSVKWVNSRYDATEPLQIAKTRGTLLNGKLEDALTIIEKTMETLFSYDELYNQINDTFVEGMNKREKLESTGTEINENLNDGNKFNDEANGFLIDAKNNLEDLPELRNKLAHWTEKLNVKETILFRLNDEYSEKYVSPAVEHAQSLMDYVDDYVSLFAHTRDEAANPLKASQAYKNIVDCLKSAKVLGESTINSINETFLQIYPEGSHSKSLQDIAKEKSKKSMEYWNRAKNLEGPISSAKSSLESQKQAVLFLKHSLNNTGIRDNQINVKLRELQTNGNDWEDDLEDIMADNEDTTESIAQTAKLIDDYKSGIKNNLRAKLEDLKREGDSTISLASETLAEAQSNIRKADSKLTSLETAFKKRQLEFHNWNNTLSERLQNLKNKIAEARNTAEGIRISLRSMEGKKCGRSYRPGHMQPSPTTTILMTFAVTGDQKEGSLFYLPSSVNDDFVALEMVNRKIRFVWNVGGGTGIVTHPEVLESGNPRDDNVWYRVEAERIRHVGKLSVRKQASTSGKYLPVLNSTNSEYSRFDVTSSDRIWIGEINESQKRPPELVAFAGLPGCVHQVHLDGKPIGLWNFVTTAPNNACGACVEGVEDIRDDVAYSFNGEGYAVRSRVSSGPYDKYTFGVSISFRTFDENALLFLATNNNKHQHVAIFLREGRVNLRIGYSENVSLKMSSVHKYNNGNWTKVDAFRQYQLRKNIEKCRLSINGEIDQIIGAPTPQPAKDQIPDFAQAKFYFGGLPPSFKSEKFALPTRVSFLGCISNINVQEGYDPMAEQYYGVEPSCGNKPLKIVGFFGDGYLEHRSFSLRKISSSMSFSFRTMQEKAMLLLSTFEGQEDRLEDAASAGDEIANKNSYYSACIIDGQVQIRLNAGKGELVLQTNNTFNDGKYHSVTVLKRRKDVELRIDDAYQTGGRLPTGAAIRGPNSSGGLFFGGLPALINNTKMIETTVPLYGALRDVIFNDEIVRFDEATSFEHALIGRSGPSMGKDPPNYAASAPLSRGMSTQPEGCQKVPYYSLEPGALKFGDKQHSHTQLYLNFKKFWEDKYAIEFDFRTYYPNGLLFITPGRVRMKHYLMVILRDGQLLLLVKSKQKKEILFKTPFNDGNWHRVVISHDERKLTMLVDSQTPRTIKIPKKIGLSPVMYIGGLPESGTPLPEQVVVKLETLKGCIRGLRVNGHIYDMVGSTSRAYNVGQCFPSVESGAYFQGEAYAVYRRNFELGSVLELQLEFRTSELSGVLLSITAPGGSPSLSLELYNGKIVMSGDLGDNVPLYVEQQLGSPYAICDNRWHKIQAVYNEEELALKVDELDQKYGLPTNVNYHFMGSTATVPLYIGGLPASAPKGTLITRDNFNGCIRNVMIGGERRDWTDMAELHNIHLSSCPVQ